MVTSPPRSHGYTSLRTSITLAVLVAVLAAGAWFGWRSLTAPVPATTELAPTEPAQSPTCSPGPPPEPRRVLTRQIRVSVFNAGGVTGLATETLNALHSRGFRNGTADNAPSDSGVETVQIWHSKPKSPQARLVAMQFDGRVQRVRSKEDLGPGIDVLVGAQYPGLRDDAPGSIRVKASPQPNDCPATATTGSGRA